MFISKVASNKILAPRGIILPSITAIALPLLVVFLSLSFNGVVAYDDTFQNELNVTKEQYYHDFCGCKRYIKPGARRVKECWQPNTGVAFDSQSVIPKNGSVSVQILLAESFKSFDLNVALSLKFPEHSFLKAELQFNGPSDDVGPVTLFDFGSVGGGADSNTGGASFHVLFDDDKPALPDIQDTTDGSSSVYAPAQASVDGTFHPENSMTPFDGGDGLGMDVSGVWTLKITNRDTSDYSIGTIEDFCLRFTTNDPIHRCGNKKVEGDEVCDGDEVDCTGLTLPTGSTYTGGTAACNSECSGYDTTGCDSVKKL